MMATTSIEDEVLEDMREFRKKHSYSYKYIASRGAEMFMEEKKKGEQSE